MSNNQLITTLPAPPPPLFYGVSRHLQLRTGVFLLVQSFTAHMPLLTIFSSLSSWHTLLERSHVRNRRCLLPCLVVCCSVVSDPIQWLWATCGWVFLEVVSSLMEACESQKRLHGDGLHHEHCVRCGPIISSVAPLLCWKVGDTLTLPWLLHLLYDECKGALVTLHRCI